MRLAFDPVAWDDLQYWVRTDRKKALRIFKLLDDIQRDAFTGLGKPEPLTHTLTGCWSRRIDQTHRIVYKIEEPFIVILTCRYHYE